MPNHPIIYTIRLDMQEDVTEEANLWNNTRHISDLLGSGFLSAVRFRSLKGEPAYLHLYELPNIELLSTQAYKNVRINDDWGPKLSHGFSNHSASLYNQLVTANINETPRDFEEPRDPAKSMGAVQSPYLLTVRMDVSPDNADELIKWHEEEHIPMMMKVPGFRSARLGRRAGLHPRTPCLDPEWIAIYELDDPDAISHPDVKAANGTEWAQRMHAVTTDVRLGIHQRIHPA